MLAYYGQGREQGRLTGGGGALEYRRTRALLPDWLPAPPAVVLDICGAAGVSAHLLACGRLAQR